jgi:release factor glutamine methyltransferase
VLGLRIGVYPRESGRAIGPSASNPDDKDDIVRRLAAAGCVAPEAEAAELLAAALGPAELDAFVGRRSAGEPLAWIVGGIDFCDLRISVDPGVYVPRWQSEPLARRAAELLPQHGVVVDLCTGAGAIACVLQAAAPAATVVATDVDALAVDCARRNGVDARLGDLDEPLPAALLGTVDVMVAVVPYVPTDQLAFLPRDVSAFEPRRALDGGAGGLEALQTVVARSARWLRPGGWLLLEVGGDQAPAVAERMVATGFVDIAVHRDDDGQDRSIEGRYGRIRSE